MWVGGAPRLISCVVVVDPEITFCLEREGHSAVLGKGVVHLMRSCVGAWVRACICMHVDHGVMLDHSVST